MSNHASNTNTRENATPENVDNHDDPGADDQPQVNHVEHEDPLDSEYLDKSEDSNYLPSSEEEASLGEEDFIILEDPGNQVQFRRRIPATARSLKK